MAERNYVIEGIEILNTITPLYNNGLPIPPSLPIQLLPSGPFGFIKTFMSLVLVLSSFLLCPASHSYFHLCLVPQSWVLFLQVFLMKTSAPFPCPFSGLHSPRQKSQPQMNHSLPFSMYHSLNSVPPKIHVEILNPSTSELWLLFRGNVFRAWWLETPEVGQSNMTGGCPYKEKTGHRHTRQTDYIKERKIYL